MQAAAAAWQQRPLSRLHPIFVASKHKCAVEGDPFAIVIWMTETRDKCMFEFDKIIRVTGPSQCNLRTERKSWER